MNECRDEVLIIGHSLVVDSNRVLFSEFAKQNISVDLIIPKRWKSNLVGDVIGVKTESIDQYFCNIFTLDCYFKGNGSFYFYSPIGLFTILNSKKYSSILIMQESWSLSLLELNLLRPFSKSFRSDLFVFVNQNIKKEKWFFLRFFERFNTFFAKAILYCSKEVKDVILWKGIDKECLYFPFSYDSNKIKYVEKTDRSTIRIGYLGRISEEKGIITLLKAFDILKDKFKDLEFYIAGSGDLVDEVYKRDYINFLGVLPHLKAHHFYDKVDIFILPSETRTFWKEQFGRVLIEASAAGCLVIGSDSGAIPEVLNRLEIPYIFKEGSVESLLSILHGVMDEFKQGKTKEVCKNSAKRSEDLFSHKKVSSLLKEYMIKHK